MPRQRFRRLDIPAIEIQRHAVSKKERVNVQRRVSSRRKLQLREAGDARSGREIIEAARAAYEDEDSSLTSPISSYAVNLGFSPQPDVALNPTHEKNGGPLSIEPSWAISFDSATNTPARESRRRGTSVGSESSRVFHVVHDKIGRRTAAGHHWVPEEPLRAEERRETISRKILSLEETESFSNIIQMMFQDRLIQAKLRYLRQQKEEQLWEVLQDAHMCIMKEEERRNLIVSKEHLDRRRIEAGYIGKEDFEEDKERETADAKDWFFSAFQLALQQTGITENAARQKSYLEYSKQRNSMYSQFHNTMNTLKKDQSAKGNAGSTLAANFSKSEQELINEYEENVDRIMDEEIYSLMNIIIHRNKAATRKEDAMEETLHKNDFLTETTTGNHAVRKLAHPPRLSVQKLSSQTPLTTTNYNLLLEAREIIERDEEKARDNVLDEEILQLIKIIEETRKILNNKKTNYEENPLSTKMSRNITNEMGTVFNTIMGLSPITKEEPTTTSIENLQRDQQNSSMQNIDMTHVQKNNAARGQLAREEREDMYGLHRDAVDSEERAVRRCLERAEAVAVDELGEAYRSATHERAVEALAAEEDAARGQLVGEEREDVYGLHRDAVDSEERAVRRCLEGAEAAAVDELGEAYRSATHERAVEALAAEEDAARGQLVGEEREDVYGLHRDAVDSEERAVRRCLERAEAAAVDELGEAYRSATHERAVEALAAEEDAARGQLVRRGA
ncbi:hypothetical protein TcBrA4_0092770 [Trypanosoma cruzi]|nr:hypothetical protein TcBrA4_0092770 [Trypanosoma cruzi]